MTLPTFLFAGTAKAGSTWIYEILREHPEVFVPDAKDIMFFSTEYSRGISWYEHFYERSGSAKAVGEVCHDYFLKEEFACRIKKHLPSIKLIFCLRDPVSWTFSLYRYAQSAGIESNGHFDLLRKKTYIPGIVFGDFIDYYNCLKPFYNFFAADNIKVFFFDELQNDPYDFVRRIYSFIGAAPDFVPSKIETKINAAQKARSRMLGYFAYGIARGLRCLGKPELLGRMKRNTFLLKILYTSAERSADYDINLAREIHSRFSGSFPELEKLIGRKLPDGWYQINEQL